MVLPPNFSFIWENLVAGSGYPGRGGLLGETLKGLREQGVLAILSLTEEPLEVAQLRELEFDYLHLPIEDFTAPTPEQITEAVDFLNRQVNEGHGALVHCRAGMGRTGTMLACFLVSRGLAPAEAISQVRRKRPGSLEVYEQEYAVHEYARSLSRPRPKAGEE